jgi:hypothetical protein
MRWLISLVLLITTWLIVTMALLSLLGPTMNIMQYSWIDTAWQTKSPSFPDYTRIVAFSNMLLSLVGSAGIAFVLTNIVYNIVFHKTHVKGFVISFIIGVVLVIVAIYILQLIISTCYTMIGIVPGLPNRNSLLYCGAVSVTNALAMVEILYTVVWVDISFGIFLGVGSSILMLFVHLLGVRNRVATLTS